jgi:DNA polymerase-3 subunit epsilon
MSDSFLHTLLDLDLEHVPFAFLDVETTGLEPQQGHRICEIAVVRTVGRVETRRYSSLVNPGRHISPGAFAVNRIPEHLLAGAPRFHRIADEVLALVDRAVIVAHNASFDLGFVNHELRLAWRPPLRNPVVDTLAIARHAYRFPRNGLEELTAYLGLPHAQQHRALGDALAMKELLIWFLDDLRGRGVHTLGDLMAVQRGQHSQAVIQDPVPPELEEALRTGQAILIEYLSAQGELTHRWVLPLRLDERYGMRYLVAYCHLRQAERSFRVDRILGVRLRGEP